jgi:hypothetical protein
MKRFVAILFACIAFISVNAQSKAVTLWEELKKQGTVSMDFSLKGLDTEGVVITSEEGKAYLQGDCYRIECGDMLICCDGTSMWLYNNATAELVIDQDEALPFMKATDVKKDQQGNVNATYVADDITFKVKVSNIQHPGARYDAPFFTIDQTTLPEDVIVTDLRD